jgi:hypothetical protein
MSARFRLWPFVTIRAVPSPSILKLGSAQAGRHRSRQVASRQPFARSTSVVAGVGNDLVRHQAGEMRLELRPRSWRGVHRDGGYEVPEVSAPRGICRDVMPEARLIGGLGGEGRRRSKRQGTCGEDCNDETSHRGLLPFGYRWNSRTIGRRRQYRLRGRTP